MKKTRNRRLSLQEKQFAKYMNIYGVARTAAIKAGYSKNCAGTQSTKLMKRERVLNLIEEYEREQLAKVDIESDKIIDQYKNLAIADIEDYYDVEYVLRYHRIDIEIQSLKTKERLSRYVGYCINQETYDNLPIIHQGYYETKERLKSFKELTKAQRAAIQGITYDRNGNAILKLSNKETSLDALSKIKGLYEKDNKQKSLAALVEQRSLSDFYNEELPNIDKDQSLVIQLH